MSGCDRCGSDPMWDRIAPFHNLTARVIDDFTLCVSCTEDLVEWIDAGLPEEEL